MKNYVSIAMVVIALASSIQSRAQITFDKTFVNNCAVLNMIPTTSRTHDYKDVLYIVSNANQMACGYTSIITEAATYKEHFGDFAPTGQKETALVILNEATVTRVGRVQVHADNPKKWEIYPGNEVGRMDSASTNTLVLSANGRYVLMYDAKSTKNLFYTQEGSLLSDSSYALLDSKGRITEIFFEGSYSIASFFYGISYDATGNITSIKELRKVKEKNGSIVKKTTSNIDLTWSGENLTRIYINDGRGKQLEYRLEIIDKNNDGLWTKAILYHDDAFATEGKFIDAGLIRKFSKQDVAKFDSEVSDDTTPSLIATQDTESNDVTEGTSNSGKELAEKNKEAERQYVFNSIRTCFLNDANVFDTDWEGNPVYDIDKIVTTYKQYQKAVQDYTKNSGGWPKSERKTKFKEIQELGSQVYALADITPGSSNADDKWYQWLALIWSECIKPDDDIHANIFVALDAVEKLSESLGKRSSRVSDAMMYLYFYLLDDDELSSKGLSKGQPYKAICEGLEMETKVWTRDMLLSLAEEDFLQHFLDKVHDLQREFKIQNNIREDYLQ